MGCDGKIIANEDSSYLFAGLGLWAESDSTDWIKNLELLNITDRTRDLEGFFNSAGFLNVWEYDEDSVETWTGKKRLILPDSWDTSNVTNMDGCFGSMPSRGWLSAFKMGANFSGESVVSCVDMFCGMNANGDGIFDWDLGGFGLTRNVKYLSGFLSNTGFMSKSRNC